MGKFGPTMEISLIFFERVRDKGTTIKQAHTGDYEISLEKLEGIIQIGTSEMKEE